MLSYILAIHNLRKHAILEMAVVLWALDVLAWVEVNTGSQEHTIWQIPMHCSSWDEEEERKPPGHGIQKIDLNYF